MRRIFLPLSLALAAPSVTAIPVIYFEEASFSAAVTTSALINFESFDTSAGAVPLSGAELSAAGIVLASPLADSLGQLKVEPEIPFVSSGNFLSVGGRPFTDGPHTDDRLTITFLGMHFAFGLEFVDNSGGAGESISVFGASGLLYILPYIPDYFGIVADEAITAIEIFELADDGDDIGYDNLRVANSVSVPEPTALSLIVLGLAGMRRFLNRAAR